MFVKNNIKANVDCVKKRLGEKDCVCVKKTTSTMKKHVEKI